MPDTPKVRDQQLTIFNPQQAATEWSRLKQSYADVSVMEDAVPNLLGASIEESDEHPPCGFGGKWTMDPPVRRGKSPEGPGVSVIDSRLIVKSYSSGGQHVAVCAAIVKSDAGDEKIEVFNLSTTDFFGANGVTEYTPDPEREGHIKVRDGFWDTLLACLGRDCGGDCLSAALSCPKPNWAAFLTCLAGRCGVCVVKCGACATCGCSVWCSPAVGCCE